MRLPLVLLALLIAGPAHAAPLSEPAVRAFVARQQAAWAAKDLERFFATFTPDAVFVDQAREPKGGVIPYGTSTMAQARVQVRRFFAASTFTETAVIDRVVIAPDGQSARVLGRKTTRVTTKARGARTLCAETQQTVAKIGGRLASRGQTETAVRCRNSPAPVGPGGSRPS